MKCSEDCCGGRGPKLYTVAKAAKFLDCSERQVREEIREGKITYRRAPGGIRFAEQDLIDRLRPSGGFSAPLRQRKCMKSDSSDQATLSFEQLKAMFDEALIVLGEVIRKQSGHTAKLVKLLTGYLCGEPCEDVSFLDPAAAKAFGVIIAARTIIGKNADLAIRSLLNRNSDQP